MSSCAKPYFSPCSSGQHPVAEIGRSLVGEGLDVLVELCSSSGDRFNCSIICGMGKLSATRPRSVLGV